MIMAFEISMGRLREAFAEYTKTTGSTNYRGDVETYLASGVYEESGAGSIIGSLLHNMLNWYEKTELPDTEMIDVADGFIWFGFYGDSQDFISMLVDASSYDAEDVLLSFNAEWDDLNEDYEQLSMDIDGFSENEYWWKSWSDGEDFTHIKMLVEPALNCMRDYTYTGWIREYCQPDYFDELIEQIQDVAEAVVPERISREYYYSTPKGKEHKERLISMGLDPMDGLDRLSFRDFRVDSDGNLIFMENKEIYQMLLDELAAERSNVNKDDGKGR